VTLYVCFEYVLNVYIVLTNRGAIYIIVIGGAKCVWINPCNLNALNELYDYSTLTTCVNLELTTKSSNYFHYRCFLDHHQKRGRMSTKRMSPLPLWKLKILMDTQAKILQD